MRSLSGSALTVLSNFKAIDIVEYAEPGEAKGMGRWASELTVQPHRAGPRAASSEAGGAVALGRTFLRNGQGLGGVGSDSGGSCWYRASRLSRSSSSCQFEKW